MSRTPNQGSIVFAKPVSPAKVAVVERIGERLFEIRMIGIDLISGNLEEERDFLIRGLPILALEDELGSKMLERIPFLLKEFEYPVGRISERMNSMYVIEIIDAVSPESRMRILYDERRGSVERIVEGVGMPVTNHLISQG